MRLVLLIFWSFSFVAFAGDVIPKTGDPALLAAFKGTLFCRYRCDQQTQDHLEILEKTYSAPGRGLVPGNNQWWGSLSHDLTTWAEQWCLVSAVNACGGLSKVAEFQFEKLQSGNWSLSPSNLANDERVLSPFAPKSEIILSWALPFEDPAKILGPFTLSGPKLAIEPSPDSITGEFHYGDCMVAGRQVDCCGKKKDDWSGPAYECLSSLHSGTSETFTVDGTAFLKTFSTEKLSTDVLVYYCEQYFWNSVGKLSGPIDGRANPCAAARSQTHDSFGCRTFVQTHFSVAP